MTKVKVYYSIDPLEQGFYWPQSKQKRKEYFNLKKAAPFDAGPIYGCNPGQQRGSIFTDDDFVFYNPPDYLEEGIISPLVASFVQSLGGFIVQSWDTAQEASIKADYSVCTTGLVVPCSSYHKDEPIDIYGECDPHYDIYILNVLKKKLEFGDLFQEVKRMFKIWVPSIVLVEKKVSGISIIQGLRTAQIPVEGMEAGESKRTRATMNLGSGSVQGWFRPHRVYFPAYAPWLEDAKKELRNFTGTDSGSGVDDFVDSLVHLTIYTIKKGSNSIMLPSEWNDPNRSPQSFFTQGPAEILPSSLFGHSEDPFAVSCDRCKYYTKNTSFCTVHKQIFSALNSCPSFESDTDLWIIR